jgi:hypothetical protein
LVMVRVAIDTRQLDSLPDLCVKTGEPTGSLRRQDFADVPGWTLLLIFWGLIPFLIARGFARRRIGVDLPASEETLRRIRLVDVGAVAGLVLAIGLLVFGWVSEESVFAWAGIAAAVITLVIAAVVRGMFWISGRLDDEILWLYGVHPAFAEQAQGLAPRDLAERVSANRWVTGLLVAALVALGVLIFLFVQARA